MKHKIGIDSLYQFHNKNGIQSLKMSIQDLEAKYTYNSIIKELNTPDVILVDDEILLLTFVDKNYQLKSAVISFDENRIESAKIYFKKLFERFEDLENELYI